MRVVVEGNLSPTGSYGIVNLRLAEQLARRGHEVAVVGLDTSHEEVSRLVGTSGGAHLAIGEPEGAVDVRIRQIWPPVWGRRGSERLIVIQPWEFGSVPVSWLSGIRDADAIWVPSEYCKRGYLQSGVEESKVWVVPNGVDAESLRAPHARAPHDALAATRLVFLGGTIHRKGVDVLIAALDELDDDLLSRVHVVVKEVGAHSYYQGQSLLEQALDAHPRVAAHIEVQEKFLAREELLELVASCDALVHPYRSEGFGLGVLEAMAVGTPVIHTRGGATNEFCGPGVSLLIPSTLTVAASARVSGEILADSSYWYEPSVPELSRILVGVIRGEIDLDPVALAASERAASWTWDRAGDRAVAALDALVAATPPKDELSLLDRDLRRSLGDTFSDAASLMSRLAALGDIASASALASLVESRSEPRERSQISPVRERLAALCETTPDVWSGAPYRSLLAAAQQQRRGHFAYAHDFEGGHQATFEIAQHLSGYLEGCESLLDVACGQGSMLRVARARGKHVQGIEADPLLVRELRADGFSIHEGFVPADLSTIHPDPFDGVFVGHLVEHLTPPEFQQLLAWIAQHIADNGTIVIQTPDFATSAVALENFWLDSTHVRPYPVRLLKSMLSSAGFVPLEGACGPVRDVAPLDVIAVGRRVARSCPAPASPVSRDQRDFVVGHFALLSGTSGFAHAARSLFNCERLAKRGVDVVRVDVAPTRDEEAPEDAVSLNALRDVEFDVAILDVPLGWLGNVSRQVRAKYRVARTTFEATPLPFGYRMALREFDEVWCFSRYDAQILIDSGVSSEKVRIMAPGIDLPDVTAVLEARSHVQRTGFRFLSVFSFEPRKNPEVLIRAFSVVAASHRECELVLKVNGVTPADVEGWLWRTLDAPQREAIRGRVKILSERVSREALSRLYLESDAFVLPTRGEGYGLPFLEAMSHGLATISPDVGGHRDYCTDENSVLVSTSSVPALLSANASVFRESHWREVDEDDLVRAMTRVVEEPEALEHLGRRALRDAAAISLATYQDASESRLIELLVPRRRAVKEIEARPRTRV